MLTKKNSLTSIIPEPCAPRRSTVSYKWYQNPEICKKVIKLANIIVDKYPTARVYSIGQTAAWVVKVAEQSAKYKRKKQTHGYIAFSGSFVQEQPKSLSQSETSSTRRSSFFGEFSKTFYMKGGLVHENQYREYLKTLGMSPKEIINKAKKGNKTVLVDWIQQGESLASFLFVLFRWADDEAVKDALKKSLEIVVLCQDYCEISSIELADLSLTVELHAIKITAWVLQSIMYAKDDESGADRLVPNYDPHQWIGAPEKLTNNAIREKIEKQIEVDVKGFYHTLNDDMVKRFVCCRVS